MQTTKLLFLAIIIFSSCSDDFAESEIRKKNIIGNWDVDITLTAYENEVFQFEALSKTQIEFSENHTGIEHKLSGEPLPFEWIYQFDPERVVTETEKTDDNPMNTSILYKVLENKADYQVWTTTSEFSFSNGTTTIERRYEYEWTMSKIE